MSLEAHQAVKQMVVELLAEQRELAGTVPTALVRHWADKLGVSPRTVWRWLQAGEAPRGERPSYELTERARELYYDCRGNVSAVHRRLQREGAGPPSRPTLARAFARALSAAERAFAVSGHTGHQAHSIQLRYEAPYRNHTWQADHKELSVPVLLPRRSKPVRPWVTLFEDDSSRRIQGWALSPYPNQSTVLAALRQGVLGDPAGGEFAGIPERLLWDNGLEFLAQSVTDVALALGCVPLATDAYAPQQKGKVERLNRTIEQEFLLSLPGHTDGPRRADGSLYGPGRTMDFEHFAGLFAEWVREYNSERPHRALDGQTPDERWRGDRHPLRTIPEEKLRWLAIPSARRKVVHDGIHHQRRTYLAPELQALVGEEVEVRYMPHDPRQLDVFHAGAWVATAKLVDTLSSDEREAVLAERERARREASRRMRRASNRARRRYLPATSDESLVETTDLSAREADADGARQRLRRMEEKARSELLDVEAGLDEPLDEEGGEDA